MAVLKILMSLVLFVSGIIGQYIVNHTYHALRVSKNRIEDIFFWKNFGAKVVY